MIQQMTIPQALDLAAREYQANHLADAETICRQILAAQAENPDALHLLGVIAAQGGQFDFAIHLIGRAIAIRPSFAGYFNSLGQVFSRAGQLSQAIEAFERAIQLAPNVADAHYNLAMAHQANANWPAAIAANQRVVQLTADFAPAYNNLGLAFHAIGQLDQAASAYERALSLSPDKALVHYNFALTLLLSGNLERGFAEYEWRCREPQLRMCREFPQPRWDGSNLTGKRILVHSEQGLGDTIQFVRYLSQVRDLAGEVILQCQPALVQLLENSPGIDRIISNDQSPPEFDVHCLLLSLPTILETTLETIPANVPYMQADAARSEKWKHRMSKMSGVKVGIVWAGGTTYGNDRIRSIPLDLLSPLAKVPGIYFISLQKGAASEQSRNAPAGMELYDWTAELDDFSDTAAVIENLDLVISVDTAVAHLAGAMKKPVWVLLPFVPDWRWMMNRADSPWYPTMRLFRQKERGEWTGPIDDIFNALRLLVEE